MRYSEHQQRELDQTSGAELDRVAQRHSSQSTDLVPIAPASTAVIFAPGGADKLVGELEIKVRALAAGLDISRPKDRAAIRSLAAKVASSKVGLDDAGKELSDDWRKRAEAIHAERRIIRERLDALRDEVRKPLTDYENAERARVEAHEAALAALQALGEFASAEPSTAETQARADQLARLPPRHWQEFSTRASDMAALVADRIQRAHAHAARREAERAELDRLRREQLERDQRERDERIAAEAAEQARREAEEQAAEAQRRLVREAAEREAIAERERQRVAREHQEALDRAEATRIAQEQAAAAEQQRLAQERAAAEARAVKAEADARAAIEAERQRQADAVAADLAAAAAREADKKHRARINGEALAALVAAGLSDAAARAAVTAVAQGKVPHIKISY